MMHRRIPIIVYAVAGLAIFANLASGENYPVVLRGKVTMPDGSPPPITVGMERVCSDVTGSKPGPLTNKKGEYLWRMDVDPMRSRSCYIQATHAGYVSNTIDISALNGYLDPNINLDPIVIRRRDEDPYYIVFKESDVPAHAKSKWKAATKALDTGDYAEARQHFQAVVEAAPKFAAGWHALGVVLEYVGMQKEAREAYEHAITFDSKLLPPHMTLLRLCIKTKDWDCAAKAADELIKIDRKLLYPDVHIHRAVALYGLKDLDGAKASAEEAIRLDPNKQRPRAEYVLGRILEAKGDLEGARLHMSKYLELQKKAPDADLIRLHIQNLGKPEIPGAEPELEHL